MAKKLKVKTKLDKGNGKGKKKAEKLDLKKSEKIYPRSYRWRKNDIDLMQELEDKVKEVSGKKYDQVKIIRGALLLASKKTPKQLLEAIYEAEMKSVMSKME